MCSKGVSVWFACKLCPSFFLNADDFAYHKKKSHIQEFRNTMFIVFEEQTTSPVSPPENWVSFLSPKEETQIHKITSSPLSSPSTTTGVDSSRHRNNENIIQNNQNEECIEIDSERNKNISDSHNESDDAGKQPNNNNFVELNSNSNLNDDADQENDKNRSNVASTSVDSALITDEKRDKLCLSKIKAPIERKTNSLRRSTRKIQNLPTNETLLQTVIQSRNNPCVYLERLNLITIQNTPSPPNNNAIPIPSQENDKSDPNHNNSDAKSATEPKDKFENQENIIQTSSTFGTSRPMAAVVTETETTTTISTTTTTGLQPQLVADELEVASGNEIQSHFLPSICNQSRSSVNELFPSSNNGNGDHSVYNSDLKLGAVLNADNNDDNLVPDPDPTTETETEVGDLDFRPAFEFVKTEYAPHVNEDNEFPNPYEERDPFESVSKMEMESSAELLLNVNVAASSSSINLEINHGKQAFQADQTSRSQCQYCISCQKYFISIRELKAHNISEHGTQYGNKSFKCPIPNCEATRGQQYLLRMHIMQVHSDARPYNCPHPNCTSSFKTKQCRTIHMKRVHRKTSSSRQVCNRFETETTHNQDVSHANHFAMEPGPELTPQTDSFRYCIPCKKYLVSLSEFKNHNKMYHMTQEGRRLFSCPYPSCTTTTPKQSVLKNHLIQVHSNVRPFKCPYPTCKMAFKTTSVRNRHFKHHANTKSPLELGKFI